MQSPVAPIRWVAIAAAVFFGVSVAFFGVLAPGYSQLLHPVGLLGANGMPWSVVFNVTAYVLPGLLAARVMFRLHALAANLRLAARLGAAMLLLAALAFALQGVLRLQLGALDSASSAPHAAAWTFWWVAYAAGAVALAIGSRNGTCSRHAWTVLACATVSMLFAVVLPGAVVAGLSQRIAFSGWFAGVWFVASAVTQLHAQDDRRQPERDQVRHDHRP